MFCPQCGKDLPDGASFCNGCGRSLSATAVTEKPEGAMGFAAPKAPAPRGHSMSSEPYQMDFQIGRLGIGDRIAGVSSLVLLIALFLPWYTFYGLSASATDHYGWMYLAFFLILGLLGYLVARALTTRTRIPLPHWQALVGITAIDLLLTIIAFASKPEGTSYGFGAVIGLIAAIAAVVGAVLRRKDPEVLAA